MSETRELKLADLLQRWQDHLLLGDIPRAEDLCRDTPELLEEFERRIACLNPHTGTTIHDQHTSPRGAADAVDDRFPAVDGYQVVSVLGKGGMGIVYKATNLGLNRTDAIKVLLRDHDADPSMRVRFHKEPQAQAKVRHENIVQVYQVGESEGRPYFSMEYIEGATLAQRLEAGPLPPREAAVLVETLARALHAAHEAGVVHRDLKPANILLQEVDGRRPVVGQGAESDRSLPPNTNNVTPTIPKIADFGLAKQFLVDAHQTGSVALVGTPAYMAPEQATGANREIKPAVDIHALGVILYECLTGTRPFKGKDVVDLLFHIRNDPPEPPGRLRRGIPRVLEAICLKCLEKDPGQRYATSAALANDLVGWRSDSGTLARPLHFSMQWWRGVRSRPWIFLAAMFVLLTLGAVLALHLSSPERKLDGLRRELLAGKTITLLPETGAPAWSRWVAGEKSSSLSTDGEEALRLSSFGYSLLELFPDVPLNSYRVNAEVQQTDGSDDGVVGIYLGRVQVESQGRSHLYFHELTYTDFRRKLPPSQVGISLRRLVDEPGRGLEGPKLSIPLARGDPAPQPQRESWRSLSIEVTPERLVVHQGGRNLGIVDIPAWEQTAPYWLPELTSDEATFPGTRPKGGLGLYVFRGSARFRSVTLEPLLDR